MRPSPRTRQHLPRSAPPVFAKMVRGVSALGIAVVILLSLAITPAEAGVEVIVSPPLTLVDPGDTFTVELLVPDTMSPFNGYDAILGYDPSLLSLLPEVTNAVREGELMTGACPSNRWNRFDVSSDSTRITINHVLLCAGVSVTGPGVVYQLRFAAKDQISLTELQFLDGTRFYDAGILIPDLSTQDGVIQIGQETGAPPVRAVTGLRAVPNPFNPSTVFHFDLPDPGECRLSIIGVDGRRVREFALGWLDSGPQRIRWDGRDQEGRRLASGRYVAHLRHASGETACGAVLLK